MTNERSESTETESSDSLIKHGYGPGSALTLCCRRRCFRCRPSTQRQAVEAWNFPCLMKCKGLSFEEKQQRAKQFLYPSTKKKGILTLRKYTYVTGRRRYGKVLLLLLRITCRVDWATSVRLSVCVNTQISAIKKTRDTKFDMKVPVCLKQLMFISNIGCHDHRRR